MEKLFELLDASRDSDDETLVKIKQHLSGNLIHLNSKHARRAAYSYSTDKSSDNVAMTPFQYALSKKKWKCARYLFDKKSDALDLFPDDFNTPLHEIAQCDNKEFLEWFWTDATVLAIISSWDSAKINQKNEHKATPFMVAIETQKEISHILMWKKYKPDYFAKDDKGRTILHLAIEFKQYEALLDFLSVCPELVTIANNIPPAVFGQYPLHLAAHTNHIDAIAALGAHGANIEARDGEQNTALHYAVRAGNIDSLMFLLKNGADPFAQNWAGDTALHLVVRHHETFGIKFEQALNVLVSYGASPYTENRAHKSPWDIAAEVFIQERDKPKQHQFILAVQAYEKNKTVNDAASLLWKHAQEKLDQSIQPPFFNCLKQIVEPQTISRFWLQSKPQEQQQYQPKNQQFS